MHHMCAGGLRGQKRMRWWALGTMLWASARAAVLLNNKPPLQPCGLHFKGDSGVWHSIWTVSLLLGVSKAKETEREMEMETA